MSTLFDIFGLSIVIVHGFDLIAQSVLVGSVLFVILIMVPLTPCAGHDGLALRAAIRRTIQVAAAASVTAVLAATGINAVVLTASIGVGWNDVADTGFVVAGAVKAIAASAIFVVALRGRLDARSTRAALGVLAAVVIVASLAGSHAAARLQDAGTMMLATGMHELGAAIWLGGLPCFRAALVAIESPATLARIGRRFSTLSIAGVGLILAGATGIATGYIGSIDALYGTAYGVMAMTKGVLLLLLGLANFRAVRRFANDRAAVDRVRHLVDVEMGIGVAVLMAAASITSMPPAIDLVENRVTLSEIADRMTPRVPRLESPQHATLALSELQARRGDAPQRRAVAFVPGAGAIPPRNAQDVAWSEYNHHWARCLLVLIGIAALAERSGRAPWARHWPLLFLLLAGFLFFRADPEVWPMGSIGLIESLKDPEVAQHRLFVVLTIGFAAFEWCVRTGRIRSRKFTRAFPLLTAIGATLLLTHSHALGNVKQELLVEMTHLPIAAPGITAGWANWLALGVPERQGRVADWLWRVCLVLIGLLLLGYREA